MSTAREIMLMQQQAMQKLRPAQDAVEVILHKILDKHVGWLYVDMMIEQRARDAKNEIYLSAIFAKRRINARFDAWEAERKS